MPLPPTYKFCPIHALIELYTKFGSDPRLANRLLRQWISLASSSLRPFFLLPAEGLAALKAQEAALSAGQYAAQQSQLLVLYFELRLRSNWQA